MPRKEQDMAKNKVITTAVRPTGKTFGTDKTSRNGGKGSSKPKGGC